MSKTICADIEVGETTLYFQLSIGRHSPMALYLKNFKLTKEPSLLCTLCKTLLCSTHPAKNNSERFEVRRRLKCSKNSFVTHNQRVENSGEQTDMTLVTMGENVTKASLHVFAVTLNSFKYFHRKPLSCDAFAIAGIVWNKLEHVFLL